MSSSNNNENNEKRLEGGVLSGGREGESGGAVLGGVGGGKMSLEKYDKSTYLGRVFSFQDRMSLRHLFHDDQYILKCKELVDLAEQGNWDTIASRGVSEKDLQEANCVVKATLHPQTNEVMHPAVRMAGFCPVNIPICGGMLLTRPTVFNSVFWQWINQTYNAFFNFAQSNRPDEKVKHTAGQDGGAKSIDDSGNNDKCKRDWKMCNNLKQFKKCASEFMDEYEAPIRGYAYATGVSVGLAVCLNEWLKRGHFSARAKGILQAIVPYTAVASAGVANVSLMRYNEIKQGIPVYSRYGEYIGHSREAAKTAVWQTAISRVVLAFPVLALPPPILSLCYRVPFLYSNTVAKILTELTVIYGGLFVGLPMAVAIFPQEAYMKFSDLEKNLQTYVDPYGREILDVVFNKGV